MGNIRIDKAKLIQSLGNVKLVLGNGFDLHCRLRTTYADYFSYDEKKLAYLEEWVSRFSSKARGYVDLNVINHKDFWEPSTIFDFTNVWDYFFYFESIEKDVDIRKWKWCDIETKIKESLDENSNKMAWWRVFELLKNRRGIDTNYTPLYVLAGVAYRKNGELPFSSKNDFYVFLLNQLKLFEQDFGYYIFRQHCDDRSKNFGIYINNDRFAMNAKITIDTLCNRSNLVSIDSFNYDSVDSDELSGIFHNINGTIDAPIFGIDSAAFDSSMPQYIFTKTNRRMELDMIQTNVDDRVAFDNVIVFGHSLDSADDSYFFSILDKIEITNLQKKSRIVFAFSVYKSEKEFEIKSSLRKAIFRLFRDYSIYKGSESPNRLLDALTTQGKILLYQIPRINDDSEPTYFRK